MCGEEGGGLRRHLAPPPKPKPSYVPDNYS